MKNLVLNLLCAVAFLGLPNGAWAGPEPEPIPTIYGRSFLKTALVARYLDVESANPAAGSKLQIWDRVGGSNQVWQVIESPEREYVYLKTEMGRYLDAPGGRTASGTPVQIWDFNGNDSQKWRLRIVPGGYYTIQSKRGLFLDVSGAGTANGTRVWLWPENPGPAQQWRFENAGNGNPLTGIADLHTHPMSHLGFGKKLMHGAPDVGSLVPAGTRDCNPSNLRARSLAEAMGHCNSTHGGWGAFDNTCGNYIRAIAISKGIDEAFVHNVHHDPFTGGNLHGDHRHQGIETSPPFLYWPHQSSVTHQQMWADWIERAVRQGGLRVLVALAVNNQLFAEIIGGDGPLDDKASADLQITEIKSFVSRHADFMEVAYSSADLRRIVASNRLAVVLGLEVDNLGNFNRPATPVTESAVRGEILRLYATGVRYLFPIHIADNPFGGAAVYSDLFNVVNRFSTGGLYRVESSAATDPDVGFRLGVGLDSVGNLGIAAALAAGSGIPFPPAFNGNPFDSRFCPFPTLGCWDQYQRITRLLAPDLEYARYAATPGGHVNVRGLSPLGRVAIQAMMRLGMMIDIDHMSEKSVRETLDLAERFGYPVNVGHNGIRSAGGSERAASRRTAERVSALFGMFGVGTANTDPLAFARNVETVAAAMERATVFPGIAIGTDANGLERLPRASTGLNAADFYRGFPQATTAGRTWDYTTEGVAHYGLMADFLKDVRERNPAVHDRLMKSAEYFALMWERCDRQKVTIR